MASPWCRSAVPAAGHGARSSLVLTINPRHSKGGGNNARPADFPHPKWRKLARLDFCPLPSLTVVSVLRVPTVKDQDQRMVVELVH